jgi:hypothetical protein
MTPWDQNEYPWTDSELESASGTIEFTTSIEVTGEVSKKDAAIAAARLFCIYALFKMSDKGVWSAAQSMGDILSWEEDARSTRFIEAPLPKKISAKSILPPQVRPVLPFEEP